MGNAQIQNSDNYLCDGGLPSTSVLSQTSLRPLCHKNGAKTVASSVCRHNDKENIPQTTINIRNRLVCSDQKKLHKACTRSDTKQFLTENDFHILKVYYFCLIRSNNVIGSWGGRVWEDVSSEKE